MSALLSEPFLLASYPTPSRKLLEKGRTDQNTRIPHVSATCSSKSNGEGFATISVQGDGIHVLELSSIHASVSHTLGPSASFGAPAITRFEDSDVSTSYAVMLSAPDGVDPKERGRTVWRWRDQQSRRPEDPPEAKHSAVFPHLVGHIWAPSALPSHVIAVSPSGQIILADQDLRVTTSSTMPNAGSTLLRSWLYKSEECAFLPQSGDYSGGMAILCFVLDSNKLKLRITLVKSIGDFKEFEECDLGPFENITDISCDPSGYTSVLIQTGEWKFFRLGHERQTVAATPLAESVHLAGMTLKTSSKGSHHGMNGPTLLSVGSSHVLLAGIVGGSSPALVLLLWDLQYSVVLATQTIPMPSTVEYTPKYPPNLDLVPASRTQALLIVSPATPTGPQRHEKTAQSRSTVFVVPMDVPAVSTIALAMGKARDTQKWLQNTHSPSNGVEGDEARSQLMDSVRNALDQGRPEAAEAAFFTWIEEETARLNQAQGKELSVNDDEIVPCNEDDDNSKKEREATAPKKLNKEPVKPSLSHIFVSSMLDIVLRPTKSSEALNSSKIALYLIDRKAVGHAMVEGGLIPALRSRKDWECIYAALKNVTDIPEADLMVLLGEVVASHRQQEESQENNMQVDAPECTSPLEQFLAALVDYTTSPPMLRLALKHYLTDVRDIVCILEILEQWVARWCDKISNQGIPTGKPRTVRKKKAKLLRSDGMPSFENVMSFMQTVLDTYFLALLQYSACHNTIERLATNFRQQLETVDDMDRLRGPVESFIRAHAKEVRTKRISKGELQKNRKEASLAAELAVGLYQIEELVI